MVGVPRSKGCRICVQRRVKCDQTRPICLRCRKGNRPCPGYDQDIKFQDEGPKLREHFGKKTVASGSRDESTQGPHASNWVFETSSSESSESSSAATPAAGIVDPGAMVPGGQHQPVFGSFESALWPMLCGGVSSTQSARGTNMAPFDIEAFLDFAPTSFIFSPLLDQDQLLYNFKASISPPENEQSTTRRPYGQWLAHLPSRTGTNPLLDNAVRACTLVHLGRLHNAEDLINYSRTYYGRALRLLNEALQDPVKGMASETLGATILLSFYEMFASDNDCAWIRHAGGAGTLMKLRGPARHRTGFDREMFLAYRFALVIQAFEAESPSFLDQPEWRELSHQIHEDQRVAGVRGHAHVFDLTEEFFLEMTQLPGLSQDAKNIRELIRAAGGDREGVIQRMISRTSIHRTRLKSLYAGMSTALKEVGQGPTSRLSGDPLFPVRFDYANTFIGAMYTGFWTVLMLMNMILLELDPSAEKQTLYRTENLDSAENCCRSFLYMASSSFHGPFFVIFALRVSLTTLNDEEKRAWIISKLEELGQTRLSMARHLPTSNPQTGICRV